MKVVVTTESTAVYTFLHTNAGTLVARQTGSAGKGYVDRTYGYTKDTMVRKVERPVSLTVGYPMVIGDLVTTPVVSVEIS